MQTRVYPIHHLAKSELAEVMDIAKQLAAQPNARAWSQINAWTGTPEHLVIETIED